ncbi:hypothetical protein CEXT_521721 [Caerostris extrusa]|uniref:Uncharacterized protein n=1 Tax=Caerostris extrusa TaxID=172846 RepID=A0AAV4STK4_CAEEX|nr:hypothetical protein CEXT_521721 [Caerostris extrusa]
MSFALRYSGETNDFPDSGIVRAYRIWHHSSCRISAALLLLIQMLVNDSLVMTEDVGSQTYVTFGIFVTVFFYLELKI